VKKYPSTEKFMNRFHLKDEYITYSSHDDCFCVHVAEAANEVRNLDHLASVDDLARKYAELKGCSAYNFTIGKKL